MSNIRQVMDGPWRRAVSACMNAREYEDLAWEEDSRRGRHVLRYLVADTSRVSSGPHKGKPSEEDTKARAKHVDAGSTWRAGRQVSKARNDARMVYIP